MHHSLEKVDCKDSVHFVTIISQTEVVLIGVSQVLQDFVPALLGLVLMLRI